MRVASWSIQDVLMLSFIVIETASLVGDELERLFMIGDRVDGRVDASRRLTAFPQRIHR